MERLDSLHNSISIREPSLIRRKNLRIKPPQPLHLHDKGTNLHTNDPLVERRTGTEIVNGCLQIHRIQMNFLSKITAVYFGGKENSNLPQMLQNLLCRVLPYGQDSLPPHMQYRETP